MKISNDFAEKNITLIFVDINKTGVLVSDDFYSKLATNTGNTKYSFVFYSPTVYLIILGGICVPFINAQRILSAALAEVIRDESTFHQVLHKSDIGKNSSLSNSSVENDNDLMSPSIIL